MTLLDKVIIAVISPLGTSLTLFALAGILMWGCRVRTARGAAKPSVVSLRLVRTGLLVQLAAGMWLVLWSLPITSNAIRASLEADFPPMTQADMLQAPRAQAIVVLGGAVKPAERLGDYPDISQASDRVWHAARLYHAGKAPLVLLSGGSDPNKCVTSEARAMQTLMLNLGVPERAMVLEEQSRNTRENANMSASLLEARGIHHILLVTSSMHMPRALKLFKAQGLQVTPAPTDRETSPLGLWGSGGLDFTDFLPSTEALDGSSRAIKEIVGRWAGR